MLTGGSQSDSQDNIDEITQQALRLLSGHHRSEQETTTPASSDSRAKETTAAEKLEAENVAPVATKEDDSLETKQQQEGDTSTATENGASPIKEKIPVKDDATMKTPDKNEIEENLMDTDMYTLEEILQLHKLSKMVAEKEKKRGNDGSGQTKDDAKKGDSSVTTLMKESRFVIYNIIFPRLFISRLTESLMMKNMTTPFGHF